MRIDSHKHFWHYDPADYPWIAPGSILQQDYLPHDLQPQLQQGGIGGCIAVQARQDFKENRFLTKLASEHAFILGVVGWIDLRSPQASKQAYAFKQMPKAVGVRHVVQDEPDPHFMAGATFRAGIAQLQQHQLAYDILIYEGQLADAIALVRDFPEQRFILDHVAKPRIRQRELQPWAARMTELSRFPNVFVKFSGMITQADPQHWKPQDLTPYWETTVQAFGMDRVLFGSDWPVIRLAGEYARWVEVVERWLDPFTQDQRDQVWGKNAQRAYLLS
jgi:L-fuconolactonase